MQQEELINQPSMLNSTTFHMHVRTWIFVALAVFLVAFLYVHSSNANAASEAVAKQVLEQGAAQQKAIATQIEDLKSQSAQDKAAIQAQIQAVRTPAQSIQVVHDLVPGVNLQPVAPAPTTDKAGTAGKSATDSQSASVPTGDQPAATISADDLKLLAQSELQCKEDKQELLSCQKQSVLEQQNVDQLNTEVTALKKVKLVPAWRKTVETIGHVALGILIGKVI